MGANYRRLRGQGKKVTRLPVGIFGMRVTHLLYLHGFRSSPQSTKARQVAARVRERHPKVTWWCPQLPPSPKLAMETVTQGLAQWPAAGMAVIGSSLGGFYASYLAQLKDCKAVLLNPAVHAARDLGKYIGEQTAWHNADEHFLFEPRFVDELRALECGPPLAHPEKILAIIAKGDEVLDWREMRARYPGAAIKLLEGGDHALSDFDRHIDDVFAFLELA
jgi:uncharacterized protein